MKKDENSRRSNSRSNKTKSQKRVTILTLSYDCMKLFP